MCRIMPDGQVPCWTGTHGEMISSDLHGAEEPTRWMLRPQQGAETGQRGLHRREGGRLAEAPLTELDLGGLCPFQWNVGLGRPRTSPRMTMTSPSFMDVLGDGLGQFWHVWQLGEAQGGLTFCSRRLHFP
jgi:hypothetical protein